MSQSTQRSVAAKCRRAPSISSRTKSGTMGSAMSCEWVCSRVAPAAAPWFLKIRMYRSRKSFLRSPMRSRYANSTRSISGSDIDASVRSRRVRGAAVLPVGHDLGRRQRFVPRAEGTVLAADDPRALEHEVVRPLLPVGGDDDPAARDRIFAQLRHSN